MPPEGKIKGHSTSVDAHSSVSCSPGSAALKPSQPPQWAGRIGDAVADLDRNWAIVGCWNLPRSGLVQRLRSPGRREAGG